MLLNMLLLPFMIYQSIGTKIDFSYDYAVFKRTDTIYLHFYYEIPHLNLFFYKQDEHFVNRHQISLQLLEKKELVAGQLFTRMIQVDTYDETQQQKLRTNDSLNITFNLRNKKTDKLNVLLKFNDLHSANEQDYQFSVELPVNISQMLFYTNNTVNPGRTYSQESAQTDTLNLYLEIYNQNVSYCSLFITKPVETRTAHPSFRRPKREKPVTVVREYLEIENWKGKTEDGKWYPLQYSLALANLADSLAGSCQLKVLGYNVNNRKLFETESDFVVETSRFQNDRDYYDLVDKLVYITTEAEMKRLKQVPVAERESIWHAFWKQYDPTPTTEINEQEIEYFERIDYCVQNFSKGDNGYRSQRARVYMKNGHPDFIESRPFERYTNPIEIWYYYALGRKYVFVDYHGFGEYSLYEETRI
ncbi:MAG: GWxTD domain-containing protein [Candidatus Latescibacteria bacterium]|nr:GWxTD domain-containing protein [Candidatus Latescibacterota bacterium]